MRSYSGESDELLQKFVMCLSPHYLNSAKKTLNVRKEKSHLDPVVAHTLLEIHYTPPPGLRPWYSTLQAPKTHRKKKGKTRLA